MTKPRHHPAAPTPYFAMSYRIVRFYFNREKAPPRRAVKTGLTLEQAQAHCRNPETSSRTCRRAAGKQRTKVYGPWFDGYEGEG